MIIPVIVIYLGLSELNCIYFWIKWYRLHCNCFISKQIDFHIWETLNCFSKEFKRKKIILTMRKRNGLFLSKHNPKYSIFYKMKEKWQSRLKEFSLPHASKWIAWEM